MYFFRPSVLFALLVLCRAAAAGEIDLKSIIQPACEKHHAPAAIAAVVREGKIEGVGVWGVRALGGDAAEAGDLSMIGSCGKSVTRLLMARLVDRGKLSFDAKLSELLPDVPMREEYRSVTVGDVIAHRAGLRPYTEIGPRRTPQLFELKGTPREQRAAFAAHLLGEAPAAKPGSRFLYSNAGYGLLGHIAERICDAAFDEIVAREVFSPLGMHDARIGLPGEGPVKPHLTGHVRGPNGYEKASRDMALPALAPAGLMSCTISDFAKLGAALAWVESEDPGEFLRPATAKRIRELRPGGGALGEEGTPFFGGDGHYTAAFAIWPSQKLAIVVASNAGDNDAVCAAILEAVRAQCAPSARAVPQEEDEREAPTAPPIGISLAASDPETVIVQDVVSGSPAAAAGLMADDRLLSVNGIAIGQLPGPKLRAALAVDRIVLKVERAGKELELTVVRPPVKP